jgi:cyclophilin family peptidyl-prolyl cis-trans isomerase
MEYVRGKTNRNSTVGYKGAKFTRLVKHGWIQLGKLTLPKKNTAPEEPLLADENFIMKHDDRGIISMVNNGPNSNSKQN